MSNERGIAMPLALMVMLILTALMVAFAVLATSEPQIASNQATSAQARALAESGIERVLWALTTGETTPTATGVLVLDANYNLPSPLPSPYNGATEVALGVGTFKVTITDDTGVAPQPNVKVVTAIGFVPNATNPIAIKKMTTKVTRIKWINPVCGLCAGSETPAGKSTSVQVGGAATINGTTSIQGQGGNAVAAGAYCSGVTPTAAVASTGTVGTDGSPNLYAPPGGSAILNGATFPSAMTLSDSDMAALKALAKRRGTYFQGARDWDGNLPSGIVFVDTPSGAPLGPNSPSSDLFAVTIHGNTNWSGWLIVAGAINISGNTTMNGLVYAQNDVTLHGAGGGAFTGAVISTNRVDTSSTTYDAEDIGNAPISYDCPAVRNGGGQLSQNWFIMPATYRELPGS